MIYMKKILSLVVFSFVIIIFTGCSNLLTPKPKIIYKDRVVKKIVKEPKVIYKIKERKIYIKPKKIIHNIKSDDKLNFKYSKCNGDLCVCDYQLKKLINFAKKLKAEKQQLLDIIENYNNNIE